MSLATPSQLYHYTSTAGAQGILTSGSLRASMIHYMNDAMEFQHALNVARELLTEIDATTGKDRCEEFLSVLSGVAIFVFSLTIHGDQLSQWRAYAANGGYALAFEFDHLQRIADANNARLVKCDYDAWPGEPSQLCLGDHRVA